jgi:murein DD-endopeptidase MepM/ murein hydrolase activator NlpD
VGRAIELQCLAGAALLFAAACASAPPAPRAVPQASRPQPPPTPVTYPLPVAGTWIVIQGYQSAGTHRGYAAYALDLVKLDDHGRAHRGDGRNVDDWHSYGEAVLAIADGVIVRARDHFKDNRIMGRARETNTVIVQHGDVYSEYVHLQRGSLRVREGDYVKRGQVLAQVGNSGCETPHLHWALLHSLEPIRTRPATLAFEARDALGQWQAASGVPSNGATIRPRSPLP